MNTAVELPVEEEEIKDNVVPFRVITGGRAGGGNWLRAMTPKTVFGCRKKGYNSFEVEVWHIVNHGTVLTHLFSNTNQDFNLVVESEKFSSMMELIEVIYEGVEYNGSGLQV